MLRAPGLAQVRAATAQVQRRKRTLVGSIIVWDFIGNPVRSQIQPAFRGVRSWGRLWFQITSWIFSPFCRIATLYSLQCPAWNKPYLNFWIAAQTSKPCPILSRTVVIKISFKPQSQIDQNERERRLMIDTAGSWGCVSHWISAGELSSHSTFCMHGTSGSSRSAFHTKKTKKTTLCAFIASLECLLSLYVHENSYRC